MTERILFQCVLPFCVLFPLVGPFATSGKVYNLFNKVLSTRFDLVKIFFTTFTPRILGTRTYFETDAKLTLDSSFAYMLMYYGIIAFVLFMVGYAIVIHRMVKQHQHAELAIILGTVVAGITEQFLFNLSFKNLTLFFLGEYLYETVLRRKENGKIWNREFCILTSVRKEVSLMDCSEVWNRFKKQIIDDKVRILAVMVATAIVCAGGYAAAAQAPDGVYVHRRSTDYKNLDEIVHLDMEQLPENFNSLVIGYQGPDADMYYFTGNIVKLERVRNTVGAGVLGAFTATVLMIGMTAYKLSKTEKQLHQTEVM